MLQRRINAAQKEKDLGPPNMAHSTTSSVLQRRLDYGSTEEDE